MLKNALAKSLSIWAARSLAVGGEHCLELRPRFRIPGAGPVDLLSIRHVRNHFYVGLWDVRPGRLGERDVDAMSRRIHAFQAWYWEFVEHVETQGFRSTHRVSVCGNLVGRSVASCPMIDLVSHWSGAFCFWIWKKSSPSSIELSPFIGKAPALAPKRAQLKGLLHHLPWQDMAAGEEAEEADSKVLPF
jgi:hypothetical protein